MTLCDDLCILGHSAEHASMSNVRNMIRRKWRAAGLTVSTLTGAMLSKALPALAALRIEVFRDFPYLYDGDLDYERGYLKTFSEAAGAIIVIARDGDQIVGASTGLPMSEAEPEWRAPFEATKRPIDALFYCGESVLLVPYRGLGIGHAFFDEREAHATALGLSASCFCGVVRPQEHPAKPTGYRPLDGFWEKRGYAPLSGIETEFAWRDIGETDETIKRLQFWGRALD